MRKLIALTLFVGLGGCSTFDFLSPAPSVYVLFFPDHSTVLTQDGRHIVDHIADDAKNKSAKLLQITGPSTQVTPGYDPSLAEPRIDAVEAALLADGISKDRMVRTSETTDGLNVTHDPSGAQRVEIRLVDKAAGS
jgi:outer membrane protein OmpA-like peptidoglycan-associated protein